MESSTKGLEANNSIQRSHLDHNRHEFSNFYLLNNNPVIPAKMSGATNLIVECDLLDIYNQYHGRKLKENLSTFLPELPGSIDVPVTKADPGLSGLIDKPPIGGRELLPLSNHSLNAFHLMPGKIPDQYLIQYQQSSKKKHRHKKHKHRELSDLKTDGHGSAGADDEIKRHKKMKRQEEGEKKRKKKDKKKKKLL